MFKHSAHKLSWDNAHLQEQREAQRNLPPFVPESHGQTLPDIPSLICYQKWDLTAHNPKPHDLFGADSDHEKQWIYLMEVSAGKGQMGGSFR